MIGFCRSASEPADDDVSGPAPPDGVLTSSSAGSLMPFAGVAISGPTAAQCVVRSYI
jgi:hypothetical protein